MAVPSTPVSASSQKRKCKNNGDQIQPKSGRPVSEKREDPKQPKRSKSPGIRVVGGRIYDSQNGKTCHQCRQKTMDFNAACKNMKQDKQCTIKFCHKCLLNRYGEKAEEMAGLDGWKCPKCRGICNCSFCMKKRGHKPTGILVHAAKATGFSSVSELLDVKGPDVCQEMIVKNKIASPKNSAALTEGPVVVPPKKRGKENSFDGTCNTNSNSQPPPSNPEEKKTKKPKKEGLKERVEVSKDNGIVSSPGKDTKDGVQRSPIKAVKPQAIVKKKIEGDNCGVLAATIGEENKIEKVKKQKKPHKHNKHASMDNKAVDVVLPQGALITSLPGINLLPEDTGHALQFLEFCFTFGEVLDIRKGQPESVLRDIMCGRSARKGKCSSAVQFLIQLLSFILKHIEEESPPESPIDSKDSWIDSLKRCLSESEFELEDIPEDCFDKGCVGYEMLNSSQKLKLLNFLCDEALCTRELRDWINDQSMKFAEKAKEAKDSLNAAKEKEKSTKRKLQDEVAKAIIAKKGAPLTISEHESIVSEIKAEAQRAREEMLEAMDSHAKKKLRSDAVRTEPILIDDMGRAYWVLKCYGDSDLLLQDMGGLESTASNEKWFNFNAEEAKLIEKHISSTRLKRNWQNKLTDPTKMKSSNSDPEVDSSSNDDSPTFNQ